MEKERLINDFKEMCEEGNTKRLNAIKYLQNLNHKELTDKEIDKAFCIDMGKIK